VGLIGGKLHRMVARFLIAVRACRFETTELAIMQRSPIRDLQSGRFVMPRVAVEENSRMSLRIRAKEKAMLLRAAALKHTDLRQFVHQHALRTANAVIEEADHVRPGPNARLLAAARALPQQ
jgi:uncharacterized protein (DUF1778 family)